MSRRRNTAQLCPKCGGQGVVSRPPGVPADQQTWVSNTVGPYLCDLCDGKKIVLVPDERVSDMLFVCSCGCGIMYSRNHRHVRKQ